MLTGEENERLTRVGRGTPMGELVRRFWLPFLQVSDLAEPLFQSGSSEIKNWISAAGALEHLNMELLNYTPAYRSAAGTGVGLAFAQWV